MYSNRTLFRNDIFMRHTEERNISLLTDFGFKRIFGTKPNKDSFKAYRDIKVFLDSAEEKGKKDKAIEIAKNLLEMGMPIGSIMKATGLSQEEIAKF